MAQQLGASFSALVVATLSSLQVCASVHIKDISLKSPNQVLIPGLATDLARLWQSGAIDAGMKFEWSCARLT